MMTMRGTEKASEENVDNWGLVASTSCSSNVDVSPGSWLSEELVAHRLNRQRSSWRIHCPDGVPSVAYDSSKNKRTVINSNMSNPPITKLGTRKLTVNEMETQRLTESVRAIVPPSSENCLAPGGLKGRPSWVRQYFPAN